ncbi:MAG: xanthine dehydrogenase family protein subunit M [Phycisphaerae bacterium]
MRPFGYSRHDKLNDAMRAAMRQRGSAYLAGGTSLVDLMKLGVESPETLVDIAHVPLTQIDANDSGASIGALVRNSDLAYHPAIRERYPVLSQAILSGASPQLRNMATLGGNLMQRPRCAYFRDNHSPCNKRAPGSGCAALAGDHRMHALLGTSDSCIATHPSDLCVALAVLDPVVHVQAAKDHKTIPFAQFHREPGTDPTRETILKPGEFILGVDLPWLPFFRKSCYVKARDRASYEFALASAAVVLDIHNGRIATARVALGGVATRPWRSTEAERALIGSGATPSVYRAAADAAMRAARPREHNSFKIELCRRVIVRALETAAALS